MISLITDHGGDGNPYTDFSAMRLPRGAGKLKTEIERLERRSVFVGKRKYPAAIYPITKPDIEDGRIARFLGCFACCSSKRLRQLRGRVIFAVSGYEDSPKEIYKIGALRNYVLRLHQELPAWLFFADTTSPALLAIMLSLAPEVRLIRNPGNPECRAIVRRKWIESFFVESQQCSAFLYRKAKIQREEIVSQIDQVSAYLGLT